MLPTNPLLNATAPAGPHLPTALLRQYAAGALAPAAQHRVEAHALACSRCADILAGLQQTPPATTDQALAQLQQRLRKRVMQQAAPARHDRDEQRNRWLIPQLAAAAALLLGLVAGGWWAWQQRHHSSPAVASASEATAPAIVPPPATTTAMPLPPPAASPLSNPQRRPSARHPLATKRHEQSPQGPALAATTTPLTLEEVPKAPPTQPLAPPAAPVARASRPAPVDSAQAASQLTGFAVRKATAPEAAPLRLATLPTAPAIAPAPVGGYSALREKLRRAATEFKPKAPEQPLSGTVQLRLTIGADGKIQQTKVVRGLRADYDAEAQRLVREGPGWRPGSSGGKRAPSEVDIAVSF